MLSVRLIRSGGQQRERTFRPGRLKSALSSAVERAVRRDWPDGGYEFIRPRNDQVAAFGQLMADHRYWRRGPMRPRLSVVRISRHEFRLHGRHRRDCRAPDCPRAAPTAAEAVW